MSILPHPQPLDRNDPGFAGRNNAPDYREQNTRFRQRMLELGIKPRDPVRVTDGAPPRTMHAPTYVPTRSCLG